MNAAFTELERLPCMRTVALYSRGLRGWWQRWRRRPADRVLCGLLWWHEGACVPFVPGEYLRAPLIHPLDLWAVTRPWQRPGPWRCPEGCLVRAIDAEGPVWDLVVAGPGEAASGGGWAVHDVVTTWRFTPCGHAFRDIDADQHPDLERNPKHSTLKGPAT